MVTISRDKFLQFVNIVDQFITMAAIVESIWQFMS